MRRLLFLATLVAVFNFSCDTDEPNAPSGGSGGPGDPGGGEKTFSATVNGDEFSAIEVLIAGASAQSGTIPSLTASGTVLTSADSTTVAITVLSPTTGAFVSGAQFSSDNGPLGAYCFGSVVYNAGATEHEAHSTDQDQFAAVCTITAIDTEAEVWSGTFSFVAEDEDSGTVYLVAEGEFTNVDYD